METSAAAALLRLPVRAGSRGRTRKERLLDQLAQFAGTSQSDFEKLAAVVASGVVNPGRVGNDLLRERAARDAAPDKSLMLTVAFDALDIDRETGRRLLELMPPVYVEEYAEERSLLGQLYEKGSKLGGARMRTASCSTSPDADSPHAAEDVASRAAPSPSLAMSTAAATKPTKTPKTRTATRNSGKTKKSPTSE